MSIVQPLADVRTAKGLPAYIAPVEWIYANFPGADNPEQIHNFMKQAYDSWGLKYLLIAGGVLAVPTYYEYEKTIGLNKIPQIFIQIIGRLTGTTVASISLKSSL